MPALGSAVARNGLAVGDSRGLGRGVHAVLALELLQDDVEVHVAQPRYDQLLGLLDAFHVQRRVFLAEPGKAARDLLLVAPGLRGDGQAVSGARKLERRQGASVLEAQRVARESVGELGRGADVTGAHLGRREVLLAARVEDLGEPLLTAAD